MCSKVHGHTYTLTQTILIPINRTMTNKQHNDDVFLREEASLLLNNEIKVISPRSQWYGHIGRVNKIMADGRTLEVQLTPGCTKDVVFLDVTLVDEVREQYPWPKQEQSLGPDANSVLPKNRL